MILLSNIHFYNNKLFIIIMNYMTKGDTIIFSPSFDDVLDHKLLNNYKKILFSNYNLDSSGS